MMLLAVSHMSSMGLAKLLSADYNIRSLVCFLFTCLKLRSLCNFSGVGSLANSECRLLLDNGGAASAYCLLMHVN
jgi:hypothetical protein